MAPMHIIRLASTTKTQDNGPLKASMITLAISAPIAIGLFLVFRYYYNRHLERIKNERLVWPDEQPRVRQPRQASPGERRLNQVLGESDNGKARVVTMQSGKAESIELGSMSSSRSSDIGDAGLSIEPRSVNASRSSDIGDARFEEPEDVYVHPRAYWTTSEQSLKAQGLL